jgi:large subunit ribosomal protein L3
MSKLEWNEIGEADKMAIGLVGRKCGMTQIFTDEGVAIPVTVIEVEPNRVTQLKTLETDGYRAIQVTTGKRRATRVGKALVGHYAKAGIEAGRGLWEFRLEGIDDDKIEIGHEFKVDLFKAGQKVDVVSTSKGKGFAGVIKRYHFATQDATHGNSLSHRAPGSIGQRQSPGRVFKGKRMGGQLGNKSCTVQSQEVVRIDVTQGLLLIKGVVPGAPGVDVMVLPAARYKNVTTDKAKA